MPALISTLIPPQSFETIRDRIGAILAVELPNQHTINNTYPLISKVWIERFVSFNSDTQLPTINVNLQRGDYDNKNLVKADGAYIYNIDVYTNATTTEATGPADQYAMVTMQKIMGMVRAIMSNPVYKTLLFDPGIVIYQPEIKNIAILDKRSAKDALSDVVGRVQIEVCAIEVIDVQSAGAALEEATTKVFMQESAEGFYYDYLIPQ